MSRTTSVATDDLSQSDPTVVRPDHTAVPTHHRPDIQALRALAVTLVVAYHFWPATIPGGFVGVDVFFVISGFLITSALLRRPPEGARDLGAFWARRILRLIPAAALTIAVTLVVVWAFRPTPEWAPAAQHGLTSMFYVENWRLISDATDYLRANATASPFQHFWSLSIEEQFYVLWPLLVGLGALLDRRLRRSGAAVLVLLAAVTVASLLWSLTLSWSEPAEAYFATPARMWQLGAGGVLAWMLLHQRSRPGANVRGAYALAGLALVLASSLLITGETVYPGWAALLPTVAAALLIHADDPDGPLSLRRLTHSRPVQLVGDCSYAIYLWHWPIVVLAPGVLGTERGLALSVALIGLTLALSWLSTRYVENALRPRSGTTFVGRRAVLVLAVCSLVVVGIAWSMLRASDSAVRASEDRVRDLVPTSLEPTCVGAGALDPDLDCAEPAELVTTPEFTLAAEDLDSDLVTTVDLEDRICREDVCPAVIGGVIVYADYNHLSATYAATLAPYLEPAALQAMATGD